MAEVPHLEDWVRVAEGDLEALHVVPEPINELTAEQASVTVGTEKGMTEHDPLATYIRKQKALQ